MVKLEETYKNKVVLVTGHTGFKGSWLCIWLRELGAKVIGYGLDPYTQKDNFVLSKLEEKIIDVRGDIRDLKKLRQVFDTYQPEMVFHLAAQPLVRQGYEEPLYTYQVNVLGTLNVLECIRQTKSVKVAIMVTTDKCYENKEQIWGYRESDPLGGYDPYSSSKAAMEIACQSWRASFFNPKNFKEHGKALATVRAGNVIGGGDWAKDRILPDCVRALEKNENIILRNPGAIRPWEHVLEPLSGYLLLGARMLENPIVYSEAWNFGPYIDSIIPVGELVEQVIKHYGRGRAIQEEKVGPHEANLLNLDISKAIFKLGWKPTWTIDEAVAYTILWYQKCEVEDVYNLCVSQIKTFENCGGGR